MAIPVAPKYVRDFEKLGFGMFVHFGLYSQMRGGEWLKIFGDAIYETVPCGVTGEHKNFGLKNEKGEYFLFVHDLARIGNVNVTVPGGGNGPKAFTVLPTGVKSVSWMDNDEPLSFKEEDGKLVVNCTGYRYGRSLVVRVAKVTY